MQVRRATSSDADVLARLRWEFRSVGRGALEESEHAFIERCSAWLRAELARDDAWSAWLVEDDTGAVGQIWVRLIDKLPNPTGEPERHAYISNLYVTPSARGGVGTKLLEACLAWLAEQNVDSILLWPSAASRSLYERHGFAVSDDVLVLSGSGSPG